MSSTLASPSKHEFLVQISDFPSSLSKRLAVRPAHLAKLTPHIESGAVVFGGATLSEPVKEGQQPEMTGSVMLIKADSEEAVKEWLKNDEYAKGGVWDVDNAVITPFKCAVRSAM